MYLRWPPWAGGQGQDKYGSGCLVLPGNTKRGSIIGILRFDWFGISFMTTDNFFFLQNRLIQTSQTGGQRHSQTSPLVCPGVAIAGISILIFVLNFHKLNTAFVIGCFL
jgi:hypothetical protein